MTKIMAKPLVNDVMKTISALPAYESSWRGERKFVHAVRDARQPLLVQNTAQMVQTFLKMLVVQPFLEYFKSIYPKKTNLCQYSS